MIGEINDDAIRQKAELLHARGEIRVLFDLFLEQHARAQEVERHYRESLVRESRTAIERDEARAGRYQLALALGFDPDNMPLAQWMEMKLGQCQT